VYRVLLALGVAVSVAACAVGVASFRALSLLDPQRAGGVATLVLAAAGPTLAVTGALRSRGNLGSSGIGAVIASLALAAVAALIALLIFLATPAA
jgi:hypothetical protein